MVEDFVGNPQINLVDATCTYSDGHIITESSIGKIAIPSEKSHTGEIVMALYPEDIEVSDNEIHDGIQCTVYSVLPAGSETLLQLTVNGGSTILLAKHMGEKEYSVGSEMWVKIEPEKINIYNKQNGNLIAKELNENVKGKVLA